MVIKANTIEELSSPLYISQMIEELQKCLDDGEGDSYTEAGLKHYWKEWIKFSDKYDNNAIPDIIDPMGKSWEQPSTKYFLIDDNYVIIDDRDCAKLATYSMSRPTGVYAGKMWKRECPDGSFILCWYGYDQKPNMCSINERYILVL